jgi:hypothetical protein
MLRMRPACLAPAALPLVLGALALAGCGSTTPNPAASGSASTPAATTAKAPAKPTAAAKRRVADAAARTEGAPAKVHVSVVLAKTGQATTAHYLADGEVGPRGGRIEIDRSLLGAGIQHEILLRQGGHLVVYTSPNAIQLPAGKTWLKVDLTQYGQRRYGADTTFFAGADQDPFQPLELLGSPVATVKDLGLDWLPDHTLNTRYEGTVDLAAAAKAAGATAKGLKQLRQDLGSPKQTIDVWVSKQGRVARAIVSGPAKAPDGSLLTVRSTIDFSAYGTKSDPQPPPAKKVVDYFTLFPK